jgi:sortase (surface protein transpeptidase)
VPSVPASSSTWLRKLRFYVTIVALYICTLASGWSMIKPAQALDQAQLAAFQQAESQRAPLVPKVATVSGRPVRIVIADSKLDLPVDPGYYDAASDEWTLSGYHAQFAMISTVANDHGGETFIYGHNNNYVFGALRHNTPAIGSKALLYTDNGHIFSYTFADSASVGPHDVSVLNYAGPPELVIQTCTGSLDELRTMYHYNFDKVVQ